jgi:hypothetical protein
MDAKGHTMAAKRKLSELIDISEIALRPQRQHVGYLNPYSYTRLGSWKGGSLVQHKRSKAIWLIQGDMAQVVRKDETLRLAMELVAA